MEALSTLSIIVDASDQAGEARRTAASLAATLGFDSTETGRVALVVTECASNLVKHGRGGEILLSVIEGAKGSGIEVFALDKGPGMRNMAQCFEDGFSTAGTPGGGLGAVARLSSHCDVYTQEGEGTALLARFWKNPQAKSSEIERFEVGGVSVAKPGEEASGDAWAAYQTPEFLNVLVVDGLGHGLGAARSAQAAIEAFRASPEEEPASLMQSLHQALRATRGAAAAVARIDAAANQLRFAGVGNISGTVYSSGGSRQMVSLPGIVGSRITSVREFTFPWSADATLLLYSDGLSTHWSLESYAGLLSHDVSLIAGTLYRDWKRGHDDATVVLAREIMR
ncbi:MAG: SpoIIE family protein phosphatase [Acidobacteriia bacterium]|nr:SpoIIE family protein phosphatase [Terriglobia bacterium]